MKPLRIHFHRAHPEEGRTRVCVVVDQLDLASNAPDLVRKDVAVSSAEGIDSSKVLHSVCVAAACDALREYLEKNPPAI